MSLYNLRKLYANRILNRFTVEERSGIVLNVLHLHNACGANVFLRMKYKRPAIVFVGLVHTLSFPVVIDMCVTSLLGCHVYLFDQ